MLLVLPGCDTVLQYPEELEKHPVEIILNVSADTSFDLLGEYEYDNKKNASPIPTKAENHQLRFTLNAYRSDDKSIHPVSVYRKTFIYPVSSTLEEVLKLELLPGDYRLVMWADYVDDGSEADKYYDTSDFSEIILNGEGGHSGSNNYRDAFYGETSLNVPEHPVSDITAAIRLKRPLAKYTFVSNDLQEFLDKETLRNHDDDGTPRTPAFSDYVVRIVYTQYMPCSFNVHTGKPADSRLGVEYYSLMSVIDEDNAQLAFDYIFTNGLETSVAVAMEVLYKDGAVVSRMPSFDVPLKRAHHTIIKGKFLTTKSGGSIGINSGYDGNFIIEIE